MHGAIPRNDHAGADIAEDAGHEYDSVSDAERHQQVQGIGLCVHRWPSCAVSRVYHELVEVFLHHWRLMSNITWLPETNKRLFLLARNFKIYKLLYKFRHRKF